LVSYPTVAIFVWINHRANLCPVNPNQWGVVAGDPLNLCMNVRHDTSCYLAFLPAAIEDHYRVLGS
jgi:hypothetical protein